MVSFTPAYYPVNDTSLSEAERAYLRELQGYAETQNLSQDLRPETRNLSIVFTVLAVFIVGLRFLARHRQNAPYGVDDWLIVASIVLLGGNLAFNMVMISQGLGLHSGLLTIEELMKLNKTVVGAEVVYTTAVNLYKISLLFLYFRIFPLPSIRKWGIVCGCISTAWNIACIFAASFQCLPRNKIWEPWVAGYCIDIFLAQLCISIPSILCDIVILCFPLPHILRLKTNRTQKAFLVVIFMLGSYVVFTSIYRFVIYLAYTKKDIPYSLAIPCAWNIVEISSGIISSSLPTLGPVVRPLIKSVMPSSLGSSSYGRGRRGGSRGTPGLITIGGGGGGGGGHGGGAGRSFNSGTPGGQSKSGWSRFDTTEDDDKSSTRGHTATSALGGSGGGGRRVLEEEEEDIELGGVVLQHPHQDSMMQSQLTTVISAGRSTPELEAMDARTHGVVVGGGGNGGTSQHHSRRESDEHPILEINKTVEVEWAVEEKRR